MTKSPLINAFVALLYISIVASIMFYGPQVAGRVSGVIVPIAVLSLFTLSAAVMGYVFLYEPAQLYVGDDREQGVTLFLQTVAIFAVVTLAILLTLFLVR